MLFGDPSQLLLRALFLIPALVLGFTLHEFAHAWVADLQGDRLPRLDGRLSLDPRRHLDPIGTAAVLLIGFGWARPVMITPARLRGQWGRMAVAAAGPAANLLIAAGFGAVLRVVYPILFPLYPEPFAYGMSAGGVVFWLLYYIVSLNVLLAIFNLIPLPPLDGYNVASALLRPRWPRLFYEIDVRGTGILMVVLMVGLFIPSLNLIGLLVNALQVPVMRLLAGL